MAPDDYRARTTTALRVLFCFGVSQSFFNAQATERAVAIDAFKSAFDALQERFGVHVLGTMDDDELMVGASDGWPWTAYILADVPDLATVTKVTTIVRDWPVGDDRLWKYVRVEARVGKPLFFGTE